MDCCLINRNNFSERAFKALTESRKSSGPKNRDRQKSRVHQRRRWCTHTRAGFVELNSIVLLVGGGTIGTIIAAIGLGLLQARRA